MYSLPAYAALQRWAAGRTVAVVAAPDADGARRFKAAGAVRVVLVGPSAIAAPEFESLPGFPALRLPTGTIDLVTCIEGWSALSAADRAVVAREARRVLKPSGVFAVWAAHGVEGGLDFWALEEELGATFDQVLMVAELPWHGVSLAPVLDDGHHREPALVLEECLLREPPQAGHYLALAVPDEGPHEVLASVQSSCVLVPLPDPATSRPESVSTDELEAAIVEHETLRAALEAEAVARMAEFEVSLAAVQAKADAVDTMTQKVQDLEASLERQAREAAAHRGDQVRAEQAWEQQRETASLALAGVERERADLRVELEAVRSDLVCASDTLHAAESQVRRHETDLAVLTRTVSDLEQSLERVSQRAHAQAEELQVRARTLAEHQARLETVTAERDGLAHQLELALAEREGGRQLAARAEAELDVTRRRLARQEELLATKLAESARETAELEVLRTKLDHQTTLLREAHSREEALSASAAQSQEQTRALGEIAFDRDRLREELGRRSSQIQALEERVGIARDDVHKERLETVRLAGEVDRAREQVQRSQESEAERARQLERLAGELRKLELERAELTALVHSRTDEVERARQDSATHAATSDDLRSLLAELAERGSEMSDLRAKLEQTRAREQDALSLVAKREQQLSVAGTNLEHMRLRADRSSAEAATLQSELDVRSLEVEQMAVNLAQVQQQVEVHRAAANAAEDHQNALQRDLERTRSEQEGLRRRLREREQELEDLASAHESSGVVVYKLRQELEMAAQSNENLRDGLPEPVADEGDTTHWPAAALAEVRRLRGQLEAQARRHAEKSKLRQVAANTPTQPRSDKHKLRRLQLEIDVRVQEQECILGKLDAAEQQIWEMNDAVDRSAARLAAALAKLERHQEQLDETTEELEVTRRLLAAAQARAAEQERLLASERAKLARAGVQAMTAVGDEDGVEAIFAELEFGDQAMVELTGPGPVGTTPADASAREGDARRGSGVPVEAILDHGGTEASGLLAPPGPRVVVESLTPDEWEGGDDEAPDATPAASEAPPTPRRARPSDTMPHAVLPRAVPEPVRATGRSLSSDKTIARRATQRAASGEAPVKPEAAEPKANAPAPIAAKRSTN